MPNYRIERISQDIKKELVEIFASIKDPRVSPMLSILRVDLSNDLSYCKVHVSAVEGVERTAESVKGLTSASGYVRHEIAKRLAIRKSPEFSFVADNSIDYSSRINGILKKLAE